MIYNGLNKIGRIYSGATAEISTVRAAVSSNYANTVHEAELPFTRHRWLVGDGVAFVRLLPVDLDQDRVYITFSDRILTKKSFDVFGGSSTDAVVHLMTTSSYKIIGIYRSRTATTSEHIFEGIPLNTANYAVIKKNGMQINGVDYQTATLITDFLLNESVLCYGDVAQIQYQNSLSTLIPAQLNRDTYSREDYNGKRRHAGECVFVDVAKFEAGLPYIFGNAASSGAFSVSDYLIEGVDFERIAGVKSVFSNIDEIPFISVYNDLSDENPVIISALVFPDATSGGRYVAVWNNGVIEFINNNVSVYDNTAKERVSIQATEGFVTAKLYRSKFVVNESEAYYITPIDRITKILQLYRNINPGAYTVVTAYSQHGVIDLIPVKLKRNIEPAVTHNGKGGTANEIGFLDKISGRFYGNDGKGAFSEYIPKTT